jgi:hypothetical protein
LRGTYDFWIKCAGAEIGQDNSYQVNGGNWGKNVTLVQIWECELSVYFVFEFGLCFPSVPSPLSFGIYGSHLAFMDPSQGPFRANPRQLYFY